VNIILPLIASLNRYPDLAVTIAEILRPGIGAASRLMRTALSIATMGVAELRQRNDLTATQGCGIMIL
jgi:hypothetical protein